MSSKVDMTVEEVIIILHFLSLSEGFLFSINNEESKAMIEQLELPGSMLMQKIRDAIPSKDEC